MKISNSYFKAGTILEEAGMIWQITLCASTFFLSAITFCWTGSERIAGYPVIVVLYYTAYLSNKHLGLIAYIPRSQVVLHIVTFLLGKSKRSYLRP